MNKRYVVGWSVENTCYKLSTEAAVGTSTSTSQSGSRSSKRPPPIFPQDVDYVNGLYIKDLGGAPAGATEWSPSTPIVLAPSTYSNIEALQTLDELTAFAAREFKREEIIMIYGGELVTEDTRGDRTLRQYRFTVGEDRAVCAEHRGNETR